jgi:LEA14-like dessication related protein
LGLLGAGCAAFAPHLEAPQLQVVGVDFLSGDQVHQKLRLRIQVTNPNTRRIAVRGIDYRLELGGADFAEGSSAAPFIVPASGQGEFDLNVDADFVALLRVLGAHLGDAALDYRVTGRVHLAEGVLRELPFTGQGRLALR